MENKILTEKIYKLINQFGLSNTLYMLFGKRVSISLNYPDKCCDAPIEELSLSVRSYNALKRGEFHKVEDVVDALCDNSLIKVRNLGIKSFVEIQVKVMEFGYDNLSEAGKKLFIENLLIKNNVA